MQLAGPGPAPDIGFLPRLISKHQSPSRYATGVPFPSFISAARHQTFTQLALLIEGEQPVELNGFLGGRFLSVSPRRVHQREGPILIVVVGLCARRVDLSQRVDSR